MTASDAVTVFSSSNHDAEMEALTIKGILDANSIPSVVVGPSVLPSLEFQVQVEAVHAAQAREAIEEAKISGPDAAAEAEAASEAEARNT
jgi:hypothetical protein